MSNLELATEHCLRTLRRRAAGEHSLPIVECIWLWATEYGLSAVEMNEMNEECEAYAEEMKTK